MAGVKDYWETQYIDVSNDEKKSGVELTDDKVLHRYLKKTHQVIRYIDEMTLPSAGGQIRLVTKRSFNTIAFLTYICSQQPVEFMYLVVFSINYEAALIIEKLLRDRKIKNAEILISNIRNYGHRDKERAVKELFVNNPHCKLFFCSSHAKVIALQAGSNYYVVEGSGNLTYNSRIEQYVIDNDKELFDFTRDWMLGIKNYLTELKAKELDVYD